MALMIPRDQRPGEELRGALSRLLREASLAVSKFPADPAGKAHFIRTRVKRLQSLCRLVPHSSHWRKKFIQPCAKMKDIFAPVRDATIVRALAEKYAPGHLLQIKSPAGPNLHLAADLAKKATAEINKYDAWNALGWGEIASRATGTYRAARNTWKNARRSNAPDAAFHEWRRRVKRLLYQCEYLGQHRRLARFTRRVDSLGEVLGDIQDICMAEEWLKHHRRVTPPPDLPLSKERLRREALRRGRMLFAARSKKFRQMVS